MNIKTSNFLPRTKSPADMEYEPYKEYDIYDMINEPRRISKDPYKLHAAFMLSCLFEMCPDDEDGKEANPNDTWNWAIPKRTLERLVENGNTQFIEACDNDFQVDIWGKQYSIRHSKDIDRTRLSNIFNFEEQDDSYIVKKNGIMNLALPIMGMEQDIIVNFKDNRAYLQKVVLTAEDDEHDGWDKLTDMEVTLYLWYLFTRKRQSPYNYNKFRNKFKDELYTTAKEERSCWNDNLQDDSNINTPYIFSAAKVRRWNEQNKQHSIVEKVDTLLAADYYYSKT